MSFHSYTHVVKTRRERQCDWCHEQITSGDPSVVTAGVFEGDFYRARYHPECHTTIPRYQKANDCWHEALPEEPMNRGGTRPKGELESTNK